MDVTESPKVRKDFLASGENIQHAWHRSICHFFALPAYNAVRPGCRIL